MNGNKLYGIVSFILLFFSVRCLVRFSVRFVMFFALHSTDLQIVHLVSLVKEIKIWMNELSSRISIWMSGNHRHRSIAHWKFRGSNNLIWRNSNIKLIIYQSLVVYWSNCKLFIWGETNNSSPNKVYFFAPRQTRVVIQRMDGVSINHFIWLSHLMEKAIHQSIQLYMIPFPELFALQKMKALILDLHKNFRK